MEEKFEYKPFPKPRPGTLMSVVYRELLEHQENEFSRFIEYLEKMVKNKMVR